MIKKQRYKVLSWVMTFLILLSTFIGLNGFGRVSAEGITILSEGFDGVTTNVLRGWSFSGTVGTYTSTGNYGIASPSLKFGATANQLLSPTFNLTAQGKLLFWIKGNSTDAISHLFVEKSNDGATWNPIEDIKPIPTTGTTKTYTLENGVKQIRFTYTKGAGNVALDDIQVIQDATNPSQISVTGVKLDKSSLNLTKGQTANLTATVEPADATNKNVTWTTDKTAVATVDQTGKITAVSAGTANITVTTADGSKTAQCAVTVTDSQVPGDKVFDIIEVTDFHGQLLDSSNPPKQVGAALAKVLKDIKASNPDRTLMIAGGDLYQGTPVSNVLHGVPVRDVFNNIGLEFTALGNHEFDWGLDVIKNETMKGANYEILCANLLKKDEITGEYKNAFAPYKVVSKDGVRIAIIGAISNETPTIVLPANIKDYKFTDAATEINTIAKNIKDNSLADVILVDMHEGGSALKDVVGQLKNVNAVFGGHSHSSLDVVYKDADGKDVPTMNANSTGKGYIDVKMTVKADNSINFSTGNYKSLTVTATSPLDSEVKAMVDKANADLEPIFSEVIGQNASPLTKDQLDQPYGESQLGNWMADVIRKYDNADVGMQNNGGIRLSPVPAGNITVGTIFYLMPFDNTICTVNMTGAQLKYLLEQAVQDGGKGIQISGVKFIYDSSKPSYKAAVVDTDGNVITPEVLGQRVQKILRESDNSEIKDTDMLKVAAPDFLATGGDTFTGFLNPEIKATFKDSLYTVRDALMADVRANNKITVVMNNRVDNQVQSGPATEITIAEARAKKTGAAIITGTVSAVSGKNVFVQDSTAGICVYNTVGASISKGDSIRVTGNISEYNGLLEITPSAVSDIVKLSSGNTVIPKEVTISQINESLEGQLIKVKDVTFTGIDNAGSSTIQDSTGNIAVYKMPVVAGLNVGDKADITAAVSQFSTNYQLAVDSAADVVKTGTNPGSQGATISVVATSDVHGNILNYDYATGKAPTKPCGLAKVSTYVKGLKANNPNVMLVDNGDTIQGTPLVYYYNMLDKSTLYPMAAAMGAMGYDAWTLGNHEFNYGLDTLNRVINDYKQQNVHVLSANTYKEDKSNFVEPYIIKDFNINGKTVKVGILGLTTKTVPSWEDTAHYAGLHFNDLVDEAKLWVPKVRAAGANAVIITAHSGEEGAADVIPENQIKAIATQVSGIDAIVAGHVHNTINDTSLKNPEGKVVPVVEPGKWAQNISQIDINVDTNGSVTGVTTKNVAMDNKIAEDTAIVTLAQPYQTATLQYTQTKLGTSTGEFKGTGQTTETTAIMELINKVQKEAAGTQLSIAAPLSATAYIPNGDITIQDIMSVYVFENFLYGVKMSGKQLKNWMEYSVRYYKQVVNPADPVIADPDLKIPDYNLDQLYGATYDIDLTEPACTLDGATGKVISGNRIKNLKFNGKLVKDTDRFTVAINNYRYNGGGGFMAAVGLSNTDPSVVTYDSAKALGDDGQVRSLMMKYIQDHKTISPENSNNWTVNTKPVVQQVSVEDIKLISSSATMLPGEKIQLFASVLPENATNKTLVWSVDDAGKAFADVDSNGIVTAKAVGDAVITVKSVDGGIEKKFTIRVATSRSMEIDKQMDKDGVTLNVKNLLFPYDIITVTIYDKNYVLKGMHQLSLINGIDSLSVGLEEGSYHIIAKGLLSGETLFMDIQVDNKAPEITVSGVEDGKTYSTAVIPTVTVDDKEALVICILDGNSFDGTAIETEGNHTLIINATDKAGNITTKVINFTIDKTAPEIILSGVEDGVFYNTSVIPIITTNDAEAEVAVSLDGSTYDGKAIEAEGIHKLDITAKDKVNNTAVKSISFTIDKTKPIITVSGIESGKTYSAKALPVVSTNEPTKVTMTLDGKDYDGSEITALGAHTLVINAKDRAGNIENVTINFNIASNDASLNIIRAFGKALDGFSVDKLKYTMEVSGALVSAPIITAETVSESAKVEIIPASSLPGTTKLIVTAEDGITQKIYEVEFKVPVIIANKTTAVEFSKGSTGEVVINALNTTDVDKDVTLSVGLYDEKNKMVKYVTKYIKLAPGANTDLTAAIAIPNDGHTYKVKVLVWDTIENMYPLAKQIIIPVK